MQNLPLSPRSSSLSSIGIDDGVSSTAATIGRCCRRQRRRSVASVDDSGDGRSPVSTTAATAAIASDAPPTINTHEGQCRRDAATETAILLEHYSGSVFATGK
ncbi:hypothetical protein Aduo_004639 [Ancylostoma duodenale]